MSNYEENVVRENFGKNLLRCRKYTKRTQTELAKRCDLTQGYVSQIEKGNVFPSTSAMTSLAKAFGITVRKLGGLEPFNYVELS